ncbi:MAG: iron-containing alcohol dehydrogenase, partial [Eubacteriales bacterium]|nr:iron-containing alcohol dehydrogenase [Eubacteriales bacterium]
EKMEPTMKGTFEKMYAFNKAVGLPTTLMDLGLTIQDQESVIQKALAMPDIDHNPYQITYEMIMDAFETLTRVNASNDNEE